jgi:uncharacterized FlaG/YvyC family protein
MDIGPVRLNVHVAAASQAPTPLERLPEHREVIEAVKAVNKAELLGDQNELTFTFDRKTRKPIVRIVNRQTHEVVRTIPAEYVKRLAEDLTG